VTHALRERLARVRCAVRAAACLADREHPLGGEARRILPAATGLSPENVELCLGECLEIAPTDAELAALCGVTPIARAAHVLLSANVFVGAHRAIAVALAASERVSVRASRREPHMPELLQRAGAPFELVSELRPSAGDHVFAYGADETLSKVRASLPAQVVFHAHGSGFGVAVVAPSAPSELSAAAAALARDVVPFDQRGCLSPRVAFVLGDAGTARRFAAALAERLAWFAEQVPRGLLSEEERAAERRYRDLAAYGGEVFAGRDYAVSVGEDAPHEPLLMPPVGRHVHVVSTEDFTPRIDGIRHSLTAVGVFGPSALHERVTSVAPRARVSALGKMQRPPLDGPVDRRQSTP
jgi:hypothetical protein